MESFIPKRCSRTVIPPTQSAFAAARQTRAWPRSEEHTSELQSQSNLVCRLLLEKKIFIKLFERVYAPLTAGLLKPFTPAAVLSKPKHPRLDSLYQRIVSDIEELLFAVGVKSST